MAEQQTFTVAEALDNQVEQLHRLRLDIIADVSRMGSLLAALELAAVGDESNKSRTLYWPDLIEMIMEKLPSTDAYDRQITTIADNLRHIAAATQQAQPQPESADAPASRAARNRRAIAEHVAA